MLSLYFAAALLSHFSIALAHPAQEERRATAIPSDPPGSVLGTPVALPSFSPTASLISNQSIPLNNKFQWQIWKACPDESRKTILQAWADNKELSDALASYKLKSDYQPAMDMYMGTRSTYQNYLADPPWDFPYQIRSTIERHQGLFEGKSSTGNANLWVYCNEDSFWFKHCTKGENPPSVILAYEQEDLFFNNWYITFCPPFFDPKWEISLQQRKSDLKKSNPYPNGMESYSQFPTHTQGHTFFHETMHMSQLVTSPQALDKAYGAKDVYDLAKNKNTDSAVYNADSWSYAAICIWAQQTFGLVDPPIPYEYMTSTPKPASVGSKEGRALDVIYVDSADVVPQGASAVPKGKSYFVDPSLWEIQDPAGGSPPAQPSVSATSTPTPPASPPSSTAPPPPPYQTGLCSFHLTETEICASDKSNLYAVVNMVDADKNDIGHTDTNDDKLFGEGINDGASYSFNSKLPHPLVITGEHRGDYIQFNYNGLQWRNKDKSGTGWCNNGGWDPKGGARCGGRLGDQVSKRNMDCFFPC